MGTTTAGTKGGFASKAPRTGWKPLKRPSDPKGPSTSGKALQKRPNQQFSGEAKHSAQTAKSFASTLKAEGGKASWKPEPPRVWYRSSIANAARSNGGCTSSFAWMRYSALSFDIVVGGTVMEAPASSQVSCTCLSAVTFSSTRSGCSSPPPSGARGRAEAEFRAAAASFRATRSASSREKPTRCRSARSVASSGRAPVGSSGSTAWRWPRWLLAEYHQRSKAMLG
mmetsp:Transcript_94976/g.268436  ORF Transcript_94976/g.268436 Transcript_94976/m.268436 type:complete len:226 (-) Transcript_94976:13-690(-)